MFLSASVASESSKLFDRTNAFSVVASASPTAQQRPAALPLMDRIVLDVLPHEFAADGQRFEDASAVKAYAQSLKPLMALTAATKLPLSDWQYQ